MAYNVTAKQTLSGESLPARLSIDGNTTSCISSISSNFFLQIDTGFLCAITMVYIALRGKIVDVIDCLKKPNHFDLNKMKKKESRNSEQTFISL